jgi:hypothetical protein
MTCAYVLRELGPLIADCGGPIRPPRSRPLYPLFRPLPTPFVPLSYVN